MSLSSLTNLNCSQCMSFFFFTVLSLQLKKIEILMTLSTSISCMHSDTYCIFFYINTHTLNIYSCLYLYAYFHITNTFCQIFTISLIIPDSLYISITTVSAITKYLKSLTIYLAVIGILIPYMMFLCKMPMIFMTNFFHTYRNRTYLKLNLIVIPLYLPPTPPQSEI